MATAMIESLYAQAGAARNVAAMIVRRPTARDHGKLRNRTKLWKVRQSNGKEGTRVVKGDNSVGRGGSACR